MLFPLIRLALRNMLAQSRRLAALHILIVTSTALVVLLIAIDGGVGRSHRRAITTLISGEVNVTGFYKVHPDAITPLVADGRIIRKAVEGTEPDGCRWRERIYGHSVLAAGKRRSESFLIGVAPNNEAGLFGLVKGTKGDLSRLSEPGTIAISQRIADKLKVQVGDFVTLFASTTFSRRNALDGRVVAITETPGLLGDTSGVIASMAFLRELYAYQPNAVGVLQLECASPINPDPLAESLRAKLKEQGQPVLSPSREAFADKLTPLLREGWYGQKLDVSTWEDEGVFLTFITSGLGALTFLVETIVLAVVIAGIFMALSVAVRERTREVGTLRAVGMQRHHIAFMFLLEGLLLGLMGALGGLLLGALACAALSGNVALPETLQTLLFQRKMVLVLEPQRVVNALLLVSVGAAVGALLPAMKASRAQPRSAMESVL